MTTRSEHLEWCKRRALQYCDAGDVEQAFASMASDLGKHPGTQGHIGIPLGYIRLRNGFLSTADAMRRFIEGFN